MNRSITKKMNNRRGAVAVLAAVMFVVLLGMIAFAVDIGYIGLARTQLQTAADSAALAAAGSSGKSEAEIVQTAQDFANANMAAGRHIQLNSNDVKFGSWDASSGTFTPTASGQIGTAVRVTVRTDAASGGETNLFFGRLFGLRSVAQEASAIATVNPRDIAFVVDLSGSMNYDTNPDMSSANSTLIQQVYDDFGFGSYPGVSQYAGYGVIGSSGYRWLDNLKSALTGDDYKYTPYYTGKKRGWRYYDADGRTVLSDATRTERTYAWVIEVQLGQNIMPAAMPPLDADSNYGYWKTYIDGNYSKLGYKSYVAFMMDNGRDRQPDGSNYTPLSTESAYCPMHGENVGGQSFDFPPREMPTHSCRRALIAAMQVIADRNANITDPNQRDWVSIITFDKINSKSPVVRLPLTGTYGDAMQACTKLQAASNYGASTGTQPGLSLAKEHIKPESQGGAGRERTNKIVVLLTDGKPNLYDLSYWDINNYKSENPSDNFYSSGNYAQNAALVLTSMMQQDNWNVYAAGVGGGCEYDFMDRLARLGSTANTDGESPRGTADPTAYEDVLKDIFEKIITNPKLRLVQ